MKKVNKLGFLFDQVCSQKIITLSSLSKVEPREYIINLIDKKYDEYLENNLEWEGEDD